MFPITSCVTKLGNIWETARTTDVSGNMFPRFARPNKYMQLVVDTQREVV